MSTRCSQPSTKTDADCDARPWERECRAFGRYLIGREPGDDVLGKYIKFHQDRARPEPIPADAFDRGTLWLAVRSRPMHFLIDSYVARFRPYSPVRRKLVLMLALLECTADGAAALDLAHEGSRAWVAVRLLAWAAADLCALMIGIAMLGPWDAVVRVWGGGPK